MEKDAGGEIMKAVLMVNGKEFPIEIQDPALINILNGKKTGYDRVSKLRGYYSVNDENIVVCHSEQNDYRDKQRFEAANYYSDKRVAEDNARADRLMRELRRYAVEHRTSEVNWDNSDQKKYCIYYNHHSLSINDVTIMCMCGTVYFDTRSVAEQAIELFKNELVWYIEKYKDTL